MIMQLVLSSSKGARWLVFSVLVELLAVYYICCRQSNVDTASAMRPPTRTIHRCGSARNVAPCGTARSVSRQRRNWKN